MAEENSLESLQALYADLLALSEKRLSSIERLAAEIEIHKTDFKNLLDKKPRNEQSRKSLATGKLKVSEDEYSVNDEFQQGALQLADELDLDELDAAQIFLRVQEESEASGRPALTSSIIRFHQRRTCVLDCFRLVLQMAVDVNQEDELRADLKVVVNQAIADNSLRYTRRCLSSMGDIKSWLQRLAEKLNSASVLGQLQQVEVLETIEYQRVTLVKQHESLAVILLYLVKEGHSVVTDFEQVLEILRKADKYDNLLSHYFLAVASFISRFGGSDQGANLTDARALNDKIMRPNEDKPWALVYVHAAIQTWWIAEYSAWYAEPHDSGLPENQLQEETKQRSTQFTEALKDGAFDFILSIAADVKSAEWYDPARIALRQWLQRKSPTLLPDSVPFSDFFQEVLMEQMEVFVESFITNLPDVLRKLRVDEDEQRQLSKEHEHDVDLEKFLTIIAYTFDGRPKAALEAFWDDPDGALVGFVHWASRRASTPLVGAFCEMLQSISGDFECATAAHHFLLDEGAQSSGRMRKTHSLTWNQIFKELTYFSSKIRDRPVLAQNQAYRTGKPHIDLAEAEPEVAMMLESYLRLITQLCSESRDARTFLAQHQSFNLSELLFQLASSDITPRLRGCAFTTLRSLLSQKTKERGDYMWAALDMWMTGGYAVGSHIPRASSSTAAKLAWESIMRRLGAGFEEPNSFIQLLHALILPYLGESGLCDDLPFPENLGTSIRTPGIDPYVDFVIGQVFPALKPESFDPVQIRLLQLSCLDFTATCLETFNEDLVIFASQSNVSVDSAMRASNLENYVVLHPFNRAMEWIFSDNVLDALFATLHQNPADVARAASDSPLVLCLLRCIQVISLVFELQSTYLDIIRPLMKSLPNYRRNPIANAQFRTFEDGVLNHLYIFPDLGRYCGTGHAELVISSLKLLEKLSASPTLSSSSGSGIVGASGKNKTLAAMNDDAETISKILLHEMESEVDLNQGPESSTYVIKIHILDFLNACLQTNPGRPTIAHLLLGFNCENDSINVDGDCPFGTGVSLFHTILSLVLNAPVSDDVRVSSWLVNLSHKGMQILKELWSWPICSAITMAEMQANDSFFALFVREVIIQPELLWNGLDVADPSFTSSTSASCLSEFLSRRSFILQYLSAELRQVSRSHSPSLKQRIFETLLGSTTLPDGKKLEHATVFDLFDFMENEFAGPSDPPQLVWFSDVDLHACLVHYNDPSSTYDLAKAEELLILRRAELNKNKQFENEQDRILVDTQAQALLQFLAQDNQVKVLNTSRIKVLRSWVQLTLLMIETSDFDSTEKTSFVLKCLQTIMPRVESDQEVVSEALELAKLVKALVFSLDFGSDSFKQGDTGDLVSDRLFHLFQVSLRAIVTLGSKVELKALYYDISYRYLAGMSDITGISRIHRRHSIQTIKTAGERFIEVVCNDAHAGEPTCRIAALLVLGALVKMGKNENSKYMIESLARLNFISILVDSIQQIPNDLQEAAVEDVGMQLSYCHARLALLLQISQMRLGAVTVLNSGLLHSVKVSNLFAVDPDLGVDIQGPDAITKHYRLLGAVIRVICAAVLSRGAQNQQTLEQGRRFLSDNRLSILAVLKKSAGLGSTNGVSEQSIEELADSFILLISVTGFLDFEEETYQKKQAKVFTAFT